MVHFHILDVSEEKGNTSGEPKQSENTKVSDTVSQGLTKEGKHSKNMVQV